MRRKLRFTNENLQVIENCKHNRVKKTFFIILLNPSNVIKCHCNVKYWNFLPELQTFTSYVLKQTGLNADRVLSSRIWWYHLNLFHFAREENRHHYLL